MGLRQVINPDQYLSYIKSRCEDDFEFFVRYFFKHQKGSKFKFSSHHKKICDALMKVYQGDITYLMVNIAPRYSKTELVVKMFSAWGMMKNPCSEFIHLSYSDNLATDNSDTVKEVIKSAEFQQLWPHIKIKPNKDAKKSWGTVQNGVFYATAAGGSVTGFGAGKIDEDDDGEYKFSGAIIIDDPLKPDDAYSDAKRNAVNRRWDETIKSRRNNDRTTPVIIIMQRLHEEDFCGMLMDDEEFEWTRLILPSIVDENTENEHSLWEDKHSLKRLKDMKSKNPYMFSAQMQQQPSPLGGGLFKDEYWQFYDVLPMDLVLIRIYADTAQKTKEHNDFSVFQCWGKSASQGLFLIDLLRGKWEAPQLESNLVAFWNKHKPTQFKPQGAQLVKVEDKSSGSSLIQTIRQNSMIPIEGIQRNIDKVTRAMGSIPHIASGHVHLPRNAPWLSDYMDEFRKFTPTMTHKHDDQIDPTMDAIEDMVIFEEMMYANAL